MGSPVADPSVRFCPFLLCSLVLLFAFPCDSVSNGQLNSFFRDKDNLENSILLASGTRLQTWSYP